jgi:UPF0042 nucleotide-binding protein
MTRAKAVRHKRPRAKSGRAKSVRKPAPERITADALRRVVVVTGMSGAGKSSALHALEDGGFETVDNLPVALLPAVVSARGTGRPLAVGIDVRTRDFDAAALLAARDTLQQRTACRIEIVFLDCDSEVIGRRYTETRRPHPLADDLPVADGIEMERRLLAPLRDADLVFDVRFLKNPHYVDALRPLSGLDKPVGTYIAKDPALSTFLGRATAMLAPLLPLYAREGKSYLTIAVGCTGGQHRSVYVVERLRQWLARQSIAFDVRHRDLPAHQSRGRAT